MMSSPIRISQESLQRFCAEILRKAGLPDTDAELTAESLVFANLRGIDSHGVVRLPAYLKRLEQGGAKPKPEIKKVRERAATVMIDGGHGLGQVIGGYATDVAVEKAGQAGVSLVAARGSAHYGAASFYAVRMARHGFIGCSTTGTTQTVAPWGGTTKILGNDPLAVAIPRKEGAPLVLDISMSKVAGGKLKLAARHGEKIPEGWGLDREGRPTDNPNDILDGGAHLPFGEHKGYGLGVMLEILNGVLTGANMLSQIVSWTRNPDQPSDIGQLFAAIDIAAFMEPSEFHERLEWFVREVKKSPPMEGVSAVYLPGEMECAVETERRRDGIPLSASVCDELNSVAARYKEEALDAIR